MSMQLSSHELQLLDTYKGKVKQWGWQWQQDEPSSSFIQLTALGCILDTCMGATDLQVTCLYCYNHVTGAMIR